MGNSIQENQKCRSVDGSDFHVARLTIGKHGVIIKPVNPIELTPDMMTTFNVLKKITMDDDFLRGSTTEMSPYGDVMPVEISPYGDITDGLRLHANKCVFLFVLNMDQSRGVYLTARANESVPWKKLLKKYFKREKPIKIDLFQTFDKIHKNIVRLLLHEEIKQTNITIEPKQMHGTLHASASEAKKTKEPPPPVLLSVVLKTIPKKIKFIESQIDTLHNPSTRQQLKELWNHALQENNLHRIILGMDM